MSHDTSCNTIDCDAPPYVPDGWGIRKEDQLPSRVRGILHWNSDTATLIHKLKKGEGPITGREFAKRLAMEPNLPANVLDWLLEPENQHLIPEEWDDGYDKYFFGTIYQNADGHIYVRSLFRNDEQWCWRSYWLSRNWYRRGPAVVRAS